jgi:hypothetical protein
MLAPALSGRAPGRKARTRWQTAVDAGARVDAATPLEWHGKFSATLPCLSWEKCTGRWANGTRTVVIRQSDGVHFCPIAETTIKGVVQTCPVTSPGAVRFALAIQTPVFRDFGL